MRCLYCGKHLPLLRKLTGGGEFCSDAHRDKYHEEYNRLAVSRLLQAQSRPDESKPVKKKAQPSKAAAHVNVPATSSVAVTATIAATAEPEGGAVAVEVEEPELQVVAYVTKFFQKEVAPVAIATEFIALECEPLLDLQPPELVREWSAPIPVSQSEPAQVDGFDLQPREEADFLVWPIQPRPGGNEIMETASPVSAAVAQVFPEWSACGVGVAGLGEAGGVTRDSIPSPVWLAFEPMQPGVSVVETGPPIPLATSGLAPSTQAFSTAESIDLTLASLPLQDAELEPDAPLAFHVLLESSTSFDSGLSRLESLDEEPSPQESVEQPSERPSEEPSQPRVNGIPTPGLEPLNVTPRKVLEVLARLHGESRQPEVMEPTRPVGPEPESGPPPMHNTLKTLTLAALAPSPAALTSGFAMLTLGVRSRPLSYSPLPLRPKMAIGNALGPVAARSGSSRVAGTRKGNPETPKSMPRSMLHLDAGAAVAEGEVETPTLFGKLGGLFGKRNKNH